VKDEIEVKEGRIGSDVWSESIRVALEEQIDGDALKSTRDVLVPATMDNETFWTRYFFRIHQIEQEEEKRKALLADATENDEDFSWEDEDDETITPSPSTAPVPALTSTSDEALNNLSQADAPKPLRESSETLAGKPAAHSAPSSEAPTPASTSPRDSSEESYDVVSSASGNVSASAEGKGRVRKEKTGEESEGDADSDWE